MGNDYNIPPTKIGSSRTVTNKSKNRIDNKIKYNFLPGQVVGIGERGYIDINVEDGTTIEKVRPLSSSYFRYYPQIGELVLVFYQTSSGYDPDRAWWIGPIYGSDTFNEPYSNALEHILESAKLTTKKLPLFALRSDVNEEVDYDPNSIYVVNRSGSSIRLSNEKTIYITTDVLKHSKDEDVPTIEINETDQHMNFESATMLLNSYSSHLAADQDFSTVYGERLVEILKWIIATLKTHRHGPHAMAYTDFHTKADEYTNNLTENKANWLINHNVRTR
jgi:hypothetical protein